MLLVSEWYQLVSHRAFQLASIKWHPYMIIHVRGWHVYWGWWSRRPSDKHPSSWMATRWRLVGARMVATRAAGREKVVVVEPILLWGIGVYFGSVDSVGSQRYNVTGRRAISPKKINMSIRISFFL